MVRYEILSNLEYYKNILVFEDDFVQQLEEYISLNKYTSVIVDVVIIAAYES